VASAAAAAAGLPQSNPWTGQKAVEGASEQASAPLRLRAIEPGIADLELLSWARRGGSFQQGSFS